MTKRRSLVLTVTILLIGSVAAVAAYGGQEVVGELRIEGQGIEQLILTGPGDQTATFEPP